MMWQFSIQNPKSLSLWVSRVIMILVLGTMVGFGLIILNRSVGLVSLRPVESFSPSGDLQWVVYGAWDLRDSVVDQETIEQWHLEANPQGQLRWRFWWIPGTQLGVQDLAQSLLVTLLGTGLILALALGISLPLGVSSAMYVMYFSKTKPWKRVVLGWSSTLSALPPVLYGLLGFWIFTWISLRVPGVPGIRGSLLAAGVTMGIYLLPGAIHASYRTLADLDPRYFTLGYSLGGSTWYILRTLVIPRIWAPLVARFLTYGLRALGDAAALLLVTSAGYVSRAPVDLLSPVLSLPVQLARWTLATWPGHLQAATMVLVYLLGAMGLVRLGVRVLKRIAR